jgi:glucose 1-dehydrogenase
MRLEHQIAIVTGAARGIGRAIARRYAQEGATVVIGDIEAEAAERTCREIEAAGGHAHFVLTDVGDPAQAEALAAEAEARFGRIDILVNNAGITGENGPVLEITPAIWDRILRVNLSGVFYCAQAAARRMMPARRGSIINISSVNGVVPQPNCTAYAATKSGVESITRSLASELGPYNIRVNTIAPGPIQARLADDEEPRSHLGTLLGRSGAPAEIAAVAAFLASDEASFITGERILVDGGKMVNGYYIHNYPRPST